MKRLYKGSKFAYFKLVPRWQREIMQWCINLKPGDIIGACTGFNHYVKSVEPVWGRVNEYSDKGGGAGKSKFVNEIIVTDTTDRSHYCPGGGCIVYPYSPEAIKRYFIDGVANIDYYKDEPEDSYTNRLIRAFKNNEQVLDDKGVLLPEWIK